MSRSRPKSLRQSRTQSGRHGYGIILPILSCRFCFRKFRKFERVGFDFDKHLVPQPHKKLEKKFRFVFCRQPRLQVFGKQRSNDVRRAQVGIRAADGSCKPELDNAEWRRTVIMVKKPLEFIIPNIYIFALHFISSLYIMTDITQFNGSFANCPL